MSISFVLKWSDRSWSVCDIALHSLSLCLLNNFGMWLFAFSLCCACERSIIRLWMSTFFSLACIQFVWSAVASLSCLHFGFCINWNWFILYLCVHSTKTYRIQSERGRERKENNIQKRLRMMLVCWNDSFRHDCSMLLGFVIDLFFFLFVYFTRFIVSCNAKKESRKCDYDNSIYIDRTRQWQTMLDFFLSLFEILCLKFLFSLLLVVAYIFVDVN